MVGAMSKPKKMQDAEARWWREHFPTVSARQAADAAVDALPVSAPMSEYIDRWIAAYTAASGRRPT
jgi:hypothetical protein